MANMPDMDVIIPARDLEALLDAAGAAKVALENPDAPPCLALPTALGGAIAQVRASAMLDPAEPVPA